MSLLTSLIRLTRWTCKMKSFRVSRQLDQTFIRPSRPLATKALSQATESPLWQRSTGSNLNSIWTLWNPDWLQQPVQHWYHQTHPSKLSILMKMCQKVSIEQSLTLTLGWVDITSQKRRWSPSWATLVIAWVTVLKASSVRTSETVRFNRETFKKLSNQAQSTTIMRCRIAH